MKMRPDVFLNLFSAMRHLWEYFSQYQYPPDHISPAIRFHFAFQYQSINLIHSSGVDPYALDIKLF